MVQSFLPRCHGTDIHGCRDTGVSFVTVSYRLCPSGGGGATALSFTGRLSACHGSRRGRWEPTHDDKRTDMVATRPKLNIPPFSSIVSLVSTGRQMIHHVRARRPHRVQIRTRPLQNRSTRSIHVDRRRRVVTIFRRQHGLVSNTLNTCHYFFRHLTEPNVSQRLLTQEWNLSPVTLRHKHRQTQPIAPRVPFGATNLARLLTHAPLNSTMVPFDSTIRRAIIHGANRFDNLTHPLRQAKGRATLTRSFKRDFTRTPSNVHYLLLTSHNRQSIHTPNVLPKFTPRNLTITRRRRGSITTAEILSNGNTIRILFTRTSALIYTHS